MINYLLNDKEEEPLWLQKFQCRNITKTLLLGSRIVYYPGALFDMSTLDVMIKTQSAHVIIYSDYCVKEKDIITNILQFAHSYNFHLIYEQKLNISEKELKELQDDKDKRPNGFDVDFDIFAHVFILQSNIPPFHHYAFVYLGMDGIYAYNLLFRNHRHYPYALVIQEHGFGMNYDRYGTDSRLHQIAKDIGALPKYIICEKDQYTNYYSACWNGYSLVENTEPVVGGMWSNQRYLHIKDK